MNRKIASEKTVRAIDEFDLSVFKATDELFSRWGKEGYYLTFAQTQLKGLFFRNSHVWESWRTLLSQNKFQGSEFLLRSLFEGVLTFEWCLNDVDSRAFRFRRTVLESTAEFYELKDDKVSIDYAKQLREGAAAIAKKFELPGMPNIRQIAEELYGEDVKSKYAFFKYLSKIIHGMFDNWYKYERRPRTAYHDDDADRIWQQMQDKSMGTYLQMQNIDLMGVLFEPMSYIGINDLKNQWAYIYNCLLADEGNLGVT